MFQSPQKNVEASSRPINAASWKLMLKQSAHISNRAVLERRASSASLKIGAANDPLECRVQHIDYILYRTHGLHFLLVLTSRRWRCRGLRVR